MSRRAHAWDHVADLCLTPHEDLRWCCAGVGRRRWAQPPGADPDVVLILGFQLIPPPAAVNSSNLQEKACGSQPSANMVRPLRSTFSQSSPTVALGIPSENGLGINWTADGKPPGGARELPTR